MINNRFWKEQKMLEWINVRDNIKQICFMPFEVLKTSWKTQYWKCKSKFLPLILRFFYFSLSNFCRKKSSSILLIMIVLQLWFFFSHLWEIFEMLSRVILVICLQPIFTIGLWEMFEILSRLILVIYSTNR